MAISRAQMGSQLTGNRMKKKVEKKLLSGMKAGGKVRGDGVCQRGKTKGRFV